MSSSDQRAAVSDPWAVRSDPEASPPRRRALAVQLGAVVLGSIGPVAAVAGNGSAGARGAWLLMAVAVGVAVVLRAGVIDRRVVPGVLGVVAVGGGYLVAVPMIGRAPVVLTVAGVLIADAALAGPPSAGRTAWSLGARTVPAVPLLAIAQVLWARGGSNVAMVALLFAAAALVGLQHVGFSPVEAVGDRLAAGTIRLAKLVGLIAFTLVALVAVYIPGGLARGLTAITGRRRRWDHEGTNWIVRDDPPIIEPERDPFATTPLRTARRRNLGGVAVLTAVLVSVVAVTRPDFLKPDPGPSPSSAGATGEQLMAALEQLELVPWSERPAFDGVAFADDLQADIRSAPLVDGGPAGYRLGDVATRYVNIVDGVRASLAPSCECPTATVYMAGGSATFGLGQRDDHTIASELVRLAGADGIALRMVNLGVPGWTISQERAGLDDALTRRDDTPDLVVFYDGYNDVIGTVVETGTRSPDPDDPAILDPEQVEAFVEKVSSGGLTVDGPALGRIAAQRYRVQMNAVADDLAGRGIESRFLFQADALSDPLQSAPVDALYRDVPPFHRLADLQRALAAASEELGPDVKSLRDRFVGFGRPVFFDSVHSNEEGARLTAEVVYSLIRDDLARVAR